MLKKYMLLAVATVLCVFQLFIGSATAAETPESVRTVPFNDAGETIILTEQQVVDGQRLFNFACAICHAGGDTKTNPTINLAPGNLAGATPSRNNIEGLVDYMNNPTTYDGFTQISELHPSTQSADIFPQMRNLTDDDLVAIAGHILTQPKILGEQWGGGKASR